VPIIRRNNCVYAKLGICYPVWMTVWYAGCTMHTRQSSTQNNVETDKYNKNKLCTKLALFTRLRTQSSAYYYSIKNTL